MDVQKVTMPPAEARKRLREYRQQLKRRADAEYEAVADAYEALAKGTPLISLSLAIQNGGFDEFLRPRLAVARADRDQVYFSWDDDSLATFSTLQTSRWAYRGGLLLVGVAMEKPPLPDGLSRYSGGYALVPLVPAQVRNAAQFQLKDCLVLWEVEQWASRRIRTTPDRDPYLLKPIGGDLYAVLAEWDLTEVERLVMAGRSEA